MVVKRRIGRAYLLAVYEYVATLAERTLDDSARRLKMRLEVGGGYIQYW
jgi:hypothetical protein